MRRSKERIIVILYLILPNPDQRGREERSVGEIIDLKSVRKDSLETALTIEQGLKLLGLNKWPENWEIWKEGIFLNSLASIIKQEGQTWVRFNRESILDELDHFMTF
jgi:hypothetical protein